MSSKRRNALRLAGTGVRLAGGGGLTFLLRDDFTTAAAAPLASPRTAEPGPGTLTITDSESKLSISSGALQIAGGKTSLAFGDPGCWGPAITRAAGIALLVSVSKAVGGAVGQVGFDTNQAGNMFPEDNGYRLDGNALGHPATNAALESTALSNAANLDLAVILATTGCVLAWRTGSTWRMSYRINTGATATLYPAIINYSMTASIGYVRVLQLAAPFDTDYGLATQRLAGARSAGDTLTHEANCLVEFVATTVPSAGQIEVRLRAQDASNYWQVTVDSSGNLDLDEVVAGTPTQRGTSAGVIANGDRIVVIADGSTIRVYDANVLRITYTSASNFATATSGKVETIGTGGAVSNLVAWPRTLTGTAASLLDQAVA